MVSLTTVYILSVILTSIAGMGSAFAGNKFVGGAYDPDKNRPQYSDDIKISWVGRILHDKLDMPRPTSQAIKEFIMTPVSEWKTVGSSAEALRVKYKVILDDKNSRQYSIDLTKIYDMVDKKYENMVKAANNTDYENIGDQSEQAISIIKAQPRGEQSSEESSEESIDEPTVLTAK